jgi:hypothetical protein
MKIFFLLLTFISVCSSNAQNNVNPKGKERRSRTKKTIIGNEQHYQINDSAVFVYKKPRAFSFLSTLPADAVGMAKAPFENNSFNYNVLVLGSTAYLLVADQPLMDGVENLSKKIHLNSDGIYNDVFKITAGKTDIKILRFPGNINTALYQMGQGFPSLLLGGGLYVYGKIKKDYRAISTASQLAESFILMGIGAQILKRISGRQSPDMATVDGGKWQPLPSFSNYQKNTPNYDAFPSGHLATLMSSVTILAENYPEKRYIKPVGYTLIGLVGYAMMNNKVHWASDYPVAIALGYICAKQVAKHNRRIINSSSHQKPKQELNYTLSRRNGILMPGVVFKF